MDEMTLNKVLVKLNSTTNNEDIRILLVGHEYGWVFDEYINKWSYQKPNSTRADRDNNKFSFNEEFIRIESKEDILKYISYCYRLFDDYNKIDKPYKGYYETPLGLIEENIAKIDIALRKTVSNLDTGKYKITFNELLDYCKKRIELSIKVTQQYQRLAQWE